MGVGQSSKQTWGVALVRRILLVILMMGVAPVAHSATPLPRSSPRGFASPASPTSALPKGVAGNALTVPASIEDAPSELTRLREEQRKAWAALNNLNPMSSDFDKSAKDGAIPGGGPFERLNRLISQPAVQAYMRFFNNPIFAKGVDQMIHSPRRMTLLYTELGFALFMLLFRAWRFSKCDHWLKKFWVSTWTFAMFWVGALVVVPWAVLGEPYYRTVTSAVDVVRNTIQDSTKK